MGLGSSAALEVATARFLAEMHGWDIPPLEMAKLCQRAENEFAGVQSGLLDQATSVFGRAGQIVHLDFQSDEMRTIPFPSGFGLIVADSGAKHRLAESEYNTRRAECAAAANALGVPSLREVTIDRLRARRPNLDPILYRRASHIVEENERVVAAVKAVQDEDATTLGALMNASHESSRGNFENSTAELDALVARARSLPGVQGARLTGGGFGGGIVALVRLEEITSVIAALHGFNCFRG